MEVLVGLREHNASNSCSPGDILNSSCEKKLRHYPYRGTAGEAFYDRGSLEVHHKNSRLLT